MALMKVSGPVAVEGRPMGFRFVEMMPLAMMVLAEVAGVAVLGVAAILIAASCSRHRCRLTFPDERCKEVADPTMTDLYRAHHPLKTHGTVGRR